MPHTTHSNMYGVRASKNHFETMPLQIRPPTSLHVLHGTAFVSFTRPLPPLPKLNALSKREKSKFQQGKITPFRQRALNMTIKEMKKKINFQSLKFQIVYIRKV